MLQIMEVKNTHILTSCTHEENNSNEDNNRAKARLIVSTSQELTVTLNNLITATIRDFKNKDGTKI